MDKKPAVALGQINLAKSSVVKLQDGGPEGSLFKESLLVYEGEFMGMFGAVKISQDMLKIMVERFNREYESPKNEHDFPPLVTDHHAVADNIKGRLIAPLSMLPWINPRTNEEVLAIFGNIRVDDDDAKEKVLKGKYSHLSISFDDDMDNLGEIFELSFVAVEAARGAQVLKQGDNMDKIAQLTQKLDTSKGKFTALTRKVKLKRTVRLAAYKSLAKNLEEISSESVTMANELGETIKSLKTNVLKSQFQSFIREGRLSKAEFDKINLEDVSNMDTAGQKIYLSSFANRPVSTDLLQHGMTGAKPLDAKGMKLSAAEMRDAIKAQKEGKEFKPALAANLQGDDDKNEAKDKDKDPALSSDLTMDDIEDALSKLEGLTDMSDKLKDAGKRMTDTLSKLQGDDEDEKEKEEEE